VVHDNNGNLTSDGTFTYTYNPRNQLTLVKQGNQTRGSNTYDGLWRRVVRTIGNSTTKPAYDGWNLVQERASNGNSVVANYLTGLGLDQPFVRTAGSSTSYYLSDALGSIVGLASTTGTVPTTYTYEPYGKTTVSGTSSASFFGFTGRENDSTGTLSLYNYRARAYSPTLQRFMSEDPLGFPGGPDANLYSYVWGNPTNVTDLTGLGNGCGFIGLSCIASGFQSLWNGVMYVWNHLENWAATAGQFLGYAALGIGVATFLIANPPAGLIFAGTLIGGLTIGSYLVASVAALSHGHGEAAGYYFTLAALGSMGGVAGKGLVGEAGFARGVGIMHLIMEALLNCAQLGCGTYDPLRI